jgi:hypothetical protein
VFVGGQQRSGTTVLTTLLGMHRDLFAIPHETRFLVDGDGIGRLIDALSDSWWGPTTAGMAVQHVRRMLLEFLTDPATGPYETYDVYSYMDRDHWDRTCRSFVESLVVTEYPAWSAWKGRKLAVETSAGEDDVRIGIDIHPRTRIVPYWLTRDEAIARCRDFVDELFGGQARILGKLHWCEKTPHNIASPVPRLLFPDSKIVHIARDPRDQISSIAGGDLRWGTEKLSDAILWSREYFRRWLGDLRHRFQDDPNYHLLFFEDLVADTRGAIAGVLDFLGLDADPACWSVDLGQRDHSGRHVDHFTDADRELFDREVAPLAYEALGRDYSFSRAFAA